MTKNFLVASLTLGLFCLAAGWVSAGVGWMGVAVLGLLLLSLFLLRRNFRPTLALVLTMTVLSAAIGLWVRVNLSLALVAVICVLAAWDLDGFAQRLVFAGPEDNPQQLEQEHITRLNLVVLLGVGLNLLSQTIRYKFGFEWALLLAILAFYGIGTLVNAMRPARG